MKRWLGYGLLGMALLFPPAVRSEVLSLRQIERLALERNLALQAGVFDYRSAFVAISENRGRVYDPRLSLLGAVGAVRVPASFLPPTYSDDRYLRFALGLNQTFFTGATAGFEFENRRDDFSGAAVSSYDPAWDSSVRLSLVQPLLKGFGPTVTEEPILLAIHGEEAGAAALRLLAVETLMQVRTLYYDIRRAREVVASREASVTLASRILEESQARVAAGVLPPLDRLEAEVGLKQRERDLLDARQNYDDLIDRLTEQLNLAERIEVDDTPFAAEILTPHESTDITAALAQRPELQQAQAGLAQRQIEEQTAANRKLPGLDLSAAYAQRGVAGTYDADLEQLATDDLRGWEVGLNFTYPLGNRQASGEALRKRYQTEAARSDLARLREVIRREVRTAIRQLEVGQVRLEVTAQGVVLAEDKLKNLLKRRDVGLSTTRDVLEGEAELASARTAAADAQATYAMAISDYLRAIGRLLEHDGVTVTTGRNPETRLRDPEQP